mmetsp:Transcript_89543/g.261723  ORF Transcript_89543/g.261723 Transcript_89543/m.261723 type:complete len:239 (+) Transcript_89543:72-788(+)
MRGSSLRKRSLPGRRQPWSQLLVPGQPLEVPRAAGAALRLTGAVLVPGAGAEGKAAAELRVSAPGAAHGVGGLALARLRATGARGAVAHLRVRMSCAEGSMLSVVGQPLWLVGRLEGASEGLEVGGGPATHETAPLKAPAPAPREKAKQSPRPQSEKEYVDLLEGYLKKMGRTHLRKLGGVIQRPPHAKPGRLKTTLMKHRRRFVVDLQGCADINHTRRYRWSAQPIVLKRGIEATED